MTAGQGQGTAAGFFGAVGRYFTIISIVPSLLLAVFVYLLVQSGASEHPPNWSSAFEKLGELGIGGTFVLLVSAAALGLVLHPLQFALVQLLEGYWGQSSLGSALRAHRIRWHVRRRRHLDGRMLRMKANWAKHERAFKSRRWAYTLSEEDQAVVTANWVEARRLLGGYPRDPRHTMPTRLGNALRRSEIMAGETYGFSIVDFAPHLMMVAPNEQVQYVNDQRTVLDLTVRCCLVCVLGAIAAGLFLWQWGLWLLLMAVPYCLAYLCYEGAVVVAREYGAALRMLVDLNRFSMYERMHLRLPNSTTSERALVRNLTLLCSEPNSVARVSYKHPESPANSVPAPQVTITQQPPAQ